MGQRTNVFGGETVPQPLVRELAQDDGWDEWSRALQAQEQRFAPTQPAPLPVTPQFERTEPAPLPADREAAPAVPRPAEITLERVMQEARRNNRVCPLPQPWTELYVILARHRTGNQRLPAPPLTGGAWSATPSLAKRMCFREHVEWAEKHGCLKPVFEYLQSLGEGDWHYM